MALAFKGGQLTPAQSKHPPRLGSLGCTGGLRPEGRKGYERRACWIVGSRTPAVPRREGIGPSFTAREGQGEAEEVCSGRNAYQWGICHSPGGARRDTGR